MKILELHSFSSKLHKCYVKLYVKKALVVGVNYFFIASSYSQL